jgi:sugar lactone lactonase YvrE
MTERFECKLLGVIEGCTNPESAELLPDGETFVFGNCALMVGIPSFKGGGGIVYLQGQAFVSRARITESKTVELDERHLIDGLTATLGCDVLQRSTSRFATGTVFMVEGGLPITADRQTVLSKAKPRVIIFDAVLGKVLGEIPLDSDSAIGRRFNGLEQPNGLALDPDGNLYVGDIPNTNPDPSPDAPPLVPPAVYRIPHDVIDELASGKEADRAASQVQRIVMPGYVNGLTTRDTAGCWAVSCHPADPVNGGIYRLSAEDFDAGVQPDPRHRDLGILDGVGTTRRGAVLASNPVTGDIHIFLPDGNHKTLAVNDGLVPMPADFNVCYPRALGGEPALLVPNIDVGGVAGGSRVAVIDLSGL